MVLNVVSWIVFGSDYSCLRMGGTKVINSFNLCLVFSIHLNPVNIENPIRNWGSKLKEGLTF